MINEKLKSLRKEKEITQENISKKLGVTRQCYALYEQGRREPSIEIIKKLCIIFGCTTDELLEMETPKERAKVQINNSFNNSNNIKIKIK